MLPEQQQELEQLKEALNKLKTALHQIVLSPRQPTNWKSPAIKASEKKEKNAVQNTTTLERPVMAFVRPIEL